MELTEDEYWYWFTNIERVGRRTRSKLLNVFESPKDIYSASENVLSELDFLTQVQKNNILARDEAGIKKEFEKLKKQGIGFLYPGICDIRKDLCIYLTRLTHYILLAIRIL